MQGSCKIRKYFVFHLFAITWINKIRTTTVSQKCWLEFSTKNFLQIGMLWLAVLQVIAFCNLQAIPWNENTGFQPIFTNFWVSKTVICLDLNWWIHPFVTELITIGGHFWPYFRKQFARFFEIFKLFDITDALPIIIEMGAKRIMWLHNSR